MFKNKKVIIFDLDGTLLDSVGIWNEIDEELISQIGKVFYPNVVIQEQRDTILRQYSQTNNLYFKYCEFLKEKYQSEFSAKEIEEKRASIAKEFLLNKVKYKPDAPKVLKLLKEKGYILVIASTTSRKNIELYCAENQNIRENGNFKEIFSLILTKEDVKRRKPNPEVHLKIMENFKVMPEECLIIEDALIGIEVAKNAGIEVIAIENQYSDYEREKINQLADKSFVSFHEMLLEIKEEI